MKKLTAILIAVMMLLSMTVIVSAEEVVFEEEVLFLSAGTFNYVELEVLYDDFMTALATPGAEMRIYRSNPTDVEYPAEGTYEKFCMTDTWWAFDTPAGNDDANLLKLGTGKHTMEVAAVQSGNPYDVNIDCLWDDGTVVAYDAATILQAFTDWMPENHGPNLVLASNTSGTNYDVVKIAVVVPDQSSEPTAAKIDIDLTGEITNPLNENKSIPLPAGVDVSDGATVVVKVKGTSENSAVRFYLTDANDVGRVTDVTTINVLGTDFDKTIELVVDYEGGFGGTAAPTHLMIKGPDYATPLANTTFEVLSVEGIEVAEEEAPAEETPAEDTPAEETPAETGLTLAVLPAVIALAVVAFKKR